MKTAFSAVIACVVSALAFACRAADTLEARFADPPASSRLQAWWHWCGDNVTREGVVADLRAMKELDIGMAHVFSPGMMGEIPGRHAKLLTPEWKEIFAAAAAEASRLGIRLGFHNCPGWSSSGGPWIRPEDSMKVVVSSSVDMRPADAETVRLPAPDGKCGFYRDIAVFAFPIVPEPRLERATPGVPTTLALSRGEPVVVTLEYAEPFSPTTLAVTFGDERAVVKGTVESSADGATWRRVGAFSFNFHSDVGDAKYIALEKREGVRFFRVTFRSGDVPEWMGGKPFDTRLKALAFTTVPMVSGLGERNSSTVCFGYRPESDPAAPGIPRDAFVDLSAGLAADGSVALAPLRASAASVWRILRIGYTTTGKTCAPATLPGLECDKLSRRGLDAHWPHMPREILDIPNARGTVALSIVDSYEVGGQNWTEDLPAEFVRRRGYALGPWLPAVAGYTVGTAGETAKFLFDFQLTVAELFAENYYDYFAELCHRDGLLAAVEAYGGAFDPIRCARAADVPTGEFWLGSAPHGSPRYAASAAHLNGRSTVGAEAFTTESREGRWQITPRQLKESGDRGWLEGVSQLVYHSYVSQPFLNVRPGLSLGRHGTQLNRNTTWWREGAGWSRYVRRGQFLLQSGESVSDALVLCGDSRANATSRPHDFVNAGYNFDFCGRSDFLRLEAKGGRVGVSGREPYGFLWLGQDGALTVAVLRKTEALLDAGVKVAGGRPFDTPSLADDPAEWRRLVASIWDGGRTNLVVVGNPLEAARKFGLPPSADSKGRLQAIRRRIEGRDFYFVMNDTDTPFADEVTFAAEGFPARWDAVTGEVKGLPRVRSEAGRVTTRLELGPRESAFVGFGPSQLEPDVTVGERRAVDLSTDWTIAVFEGPAAPSAPRTLARLASWSESDEPQLRYFSGRAVYEKTLGPSLFKDVLVGSAARVVLDLGEVRDVVNLSVDGRFLACLWAPPYRIALPSATVESARSRGLELRLEVVNTWPNRMIGDAIARRDGAAEPKRDGYPEWVLADESDSGTGIYTWSNFDYGWTAGDRPLPAGLIGPVSLWYNR